MKKILTLLLSLMAVLPICAQEWIDVTTGYIQNPKFTSNVTGWDLDVPNASNLGRQATSYTNGTIRLSSFLEAYSDWGDLYDGTMKQTISLKKGQYRLSVDAIAVHQSTWNWWGESTSESPAERVYLYVSTDKGELFKTKMSTANNKPRHYSVEFTLKENSVVDLGVLLDETDANWVAVDNFTLEWYGVVTHVNAAEMSEASITIVPTETHYLSANALPDEAIYRNFTWTTSNAGVATVDATGKVTGVGIGTCVITAKSVDNEDVTTTCQVTVDAGIATADNVIINEIMAANIDVYLDPSFNFGSWAELYNPTDRSVLLGELYITEDENNLKQHRLVKEYGVLPAHGFAILNFEHNEPYKVPSHRQIESKLDCDGGTLYITDGTQIITKADYPEAIGRASYARTTDGGDEWSWTGFPTPGSTNAKCVFASEQIPAPVVDTDGQKFKGTLKVTVQIPEGAKLLYTLDGLAPTLENGTESKNGVFTFQSTTTIRFRLFKDGYLPSQVVTRSFIKDDGYSLPIISIVTDDKNIYSTEYGLFEQGPNGRPGAGQDANCNWNMDWDRPVSFEYITADNKYAISQEVDMAMCGGWSRAWTPHSFKLKASKAYDLKNTLDYQFFASKPFLKHKTLQIRNGGNDNNRRIKDAALQEIVSRSGLYVDAQAWQPVHVFINGSYYSILNMREPNNKHFAYSNYGIDTDEMDQFEMSPDSAYVQMEGTNEKFLEWYSLSSKCAADSIYEKICKIVDIDEYINYMAVELYIGNWDWPQNNVKGFRDINDGKFHFVLFDLDGAFQANNSFSTFAGKKTYQFDALRGKYWNGTSLKRRNEEIKFVTIFLNMLKNEKFRKQFIDSFCIVGGSVYEPTRSKAIVTEMATLNEKAGLNSWSTANDVISKLQSLNTTMTSYLKGYSSFKLTGTAAQNVTLSSNVDNAKLSINGLTVPTGYFKGRLFGPVTFTAQAPSGYKFKGWTNKSTSNITSIFGSNVTWRYYDAASLDKADWTSNTYAETGWKSGFAPIGYGKNQKTNVTGNKSCYYFRKTFNIDNTPSSNDEYILDYTIDDGMIVYVNGKEVGRYNMPSGTVSYSTLASTYANNNPDTGTMTISGSYFKKGSNVIAVEVHNNNTTSTDILWEASLSAKTTDTEEITYVSTEPEYTMPTTSNVTLVAIFEEMSEAEMIAANSKPVMVNEISASNTMYVNDYFKKNDWIELYNTTGEDIDIAGMYISDNLNKPQKYQVPADDVTLNTIVPAHGYKVIWADKLENIGSDIHTTFKLAAEGGDVVISTDVYADTLTYHAHNSNQTFGRFPDGTANTYIMNIPTIGNNNKISTSDSLFNSALTPDADNIKVLTTEEGLTIAFINGVINARSDNSPIIALEIYSTAGQKVASQPSFRSGNKFASVRVAELPSGVYIARTIAKDGNECHIKFINK